MALAALLLVLFTFCKSGNEIKTRDLHFDQGAPVAWVNDVEITALRFEESYLNHLLKTGANDTRQERYSHLQTMIQDFLLAEKAEAYGLLDEEYQLYVEQARQKAMADYYYQRSFLDTLSLPTEAQIRAAFFNTKVKVYPRMLYFKDKTQADEYYSRLQNGEDFVDLANELYQLPEYDSLAGYMGEISYFGVDHDFAEAAFGLRAGEFSEPFRTRLGYYIVKLDNRVTQAIITEDEYQQKREGMLQKTKERLMNVKGDEYVRNVMESLNVQLNTNHVAGLFELINEISGTMEAEASGENVLSRRGGISRNDIAFLKQETNETSVLASYQLNGETFYFTVADYLFWLPNLPFEEARHRTMASVGRALRNKVFAQLGEQNGLGDSDYVTFKKEEAEQLYKTWAVKKHLSEQPTGEISEEELRTAFYAMKLNTLKTARFTGWLIERESYPEITQVKQLVEAGKEPSSIEGFRAFNNADIRKEYGILDYLLKVPMQIPTVVNTNQKFYLMYAHERFTEYNTFEDVRPVVENKVRKYYNIVQEIKNLQSTASVSIDTLAFEKMMEHFNDPSLTGFQN